MANSSLHETSKCFGLVLLSFLVLPVSTIVALVSIFFSTQPRTRASPPPNPDPLPERKPTDPNCRRPPQRTILVTGVGMAKGLSLARAFHLSGHRVIGADTSPHPLIPCPGRFSRALSAFYRLPTTTAADDDDDNAYARRLVAVVEAERVDLWVSCSGVAGAAQDARAKEAVEAAAGTRRRCRCRCVQFGARETAALHEKDAFVRESAARGLPVPETHEVRSREEILGILFSSAGSEEKKQEEEEEEGGGRSRSRKRKRFILKPVGVDDANRGDMTLLPLATEGETRRHLACRLPASAERPWILQRFVPGGEEYCTHALVVRGEVRCFAACPSSELLMHYEALPRDSPLLLDMLDFTARFVARSPSPETMTGHLSFDFMVDSNGESSGGGNDDDDKTPGRGKILYAIECNPRAHTAVVLFAQQGPEMEAMVQAYLSVIDGAQDGEVNGVLSKTKNVGRSVVMPAPDSRARYWIGHDLVSFLIQPVARFAAGRLKLNQLSAAFVKFLTHIWSWKDGTFEAWDPLPALILYHLYWPSMFMLTWWQGRRWSRVNVSTTKMFLY
ncbi:carbamoylphosphate synthase large subunit [Biscogniauxia mediterranea]|nr:carbamoylphosphate synthase large subunit [Biscogniauxia mediterranea]